MHSLPSFSTMLILLPTPLLPKVLPSPLCCPILSHPLHFLHPAFACPLSFATKRTHSLTRSMAPADDAVPASSQRQPNRRPFGVLFVCLGNICRSPTAEAVFRYAVEKRSLESNFNVDSAGTINYHEGQPADSRMKAAALKRGVKLTSISRPIRPVDFEEFDLILAMDEQNKEDILNKYDRWSKKEALHPKGKEKVKLICSYCKMHRETEVPDPYYGGPEGFEKVLDLLEDACESLLDSIVATLCGCGGGEALKI